MTSIPLQCFALLGKCQSTARPGFISSCRTLPLNPPVARIPTGRLSMYLRSPYNLMSTTASRAQQIGTEEKPIDASEGVEVDGRSYIQSSTNAHEPAAATQIGKDDGSAAGNAAANSPSGNGSPRIRFLAAKDTSLRLYPATTRDPETVASSPRIRHLPSGESDPAKRSPKIQDKPSHIEPITSIASLRSKRRKALLADRRVGLVPTMGALHQGHLQLIKTAAYQCDDIYVTIFVNPTQFAANEDFNTYPNDLSIDLAAIQKLNTDLTAGNYRGRLSVVFCPDAKTMYPFGLEKSSHVVMNPEITQVLEGKSRPTFFQGVTTVVMKLLNIVQPDIVYFGEKDIQQLIVIERMVQEFQIGVRVHGVGIKREADGLAMSSRNVYLGKRRRKVALSNYRTLKAVEAKLKNGVMARSKLLETAVQTATALQNEQRALPPSQRARFEMDYFSIADPATLKELDVVDEKKGAILSAAIMMLPLEDVQPGEKLGAGGDTNTVRLIDNIIYHKSFILRKN